jgi:hypothetical protein
VQGVEPNRFGNAHKGNPYPAGDERAAINTAFDDFVNALHVAEGKLGESTKIIGQSKEEWKTPEIKEMWQTPSIEDITPAKPITTEEKKDQLEDEMKALDQADTAPWRRLEQTVNRTATLAATFASHLREGGEFGNILVARKMAKEAGFDGRCESGRGSDGAWRGQLARQIVADRSDPKANFTALVDLYSRQPKLGTRTSTSMRDQAFSTPVPLAYVASRLAGSGRDDKVLSRRAGNGALLIEAVRQKTSPTRSTRSAPRTSSAQGFSPSTEKDATESGSLPPASKHRRGCGHRQSPVWCGAAGGRIAGLRPLRHPKGLQNQGDRPRHCAAGLAGDARQWPGGAHHRRPQQAGRQPGSPVGRLQLQGQKRVFQNPLRRYNVTDHFTVAGELYERQGAGWPVDVIVIDGRGKSERSLPAVDVPRVLTSWDQLGGLIDVSGRSDGATDRTADGTAGAGPGERDGRGRGDGERVSEPDAGSQPARRSSAGTCSATRQMSGLVEKDAAESAGDERGDTERTGDKPPASDGHLD